MTLSIECPSRHIWGSLRSKEILCLVPVNRHLVFRILRLRRLESNHSFRLLKPWVRDENSSSGSLEANVRLVSSAYILTSDRRLQFGRLLMYNRNSRGPRIEPWGTPQYMKLISEFTLLITVTWVLSERKSRKRLRLAPLNPYSSNFDRRISWSIVSNTFFKSINRPAFVKPSSMLRYQLSVISIRAERVQCMGLKPDWYLESSLFSFKYVYTWLKMAF